MLGLHVHVFANRMRLSMSISPMTKVLNLNRRRRLYRRTTTGHYTRRTGRPTKSGLNRAVWLPGWASYRLRQGLPDHCQLSPNPLRHYGWHNPIYENTDYRYAIVFYYIIIIFNLYNINANFIVESVEVQLPSVPIGSLDYLLPSMDTTQTRFLRRPSDKIRLASKITKLFLFTFPGRQITIERLLSCLPGF